MLPVRPAHVRRDPGVILAEPNHLLFPADLGAELACQLVEHALEARLGEQQQVHRRLGQARHVHVHLAERQPECRNRPRAGHFESLQQAAVAQHLHNLPAQTAGLRNLPDLRMLLQHQRIHSGQTQLDRQHQAGRTGAHDDHVRVHQPPPPCP